MLKTTGGELAGCLKGFTLARYRFIIKPLQAMLLPEFKGATFRGGLGSVFRRLVCLREGENCVGCILRTRCAYSYCFETPSGGDNAARSSHWPHPYVLEPPADKQRIFDADEVISFHLVLVGRGLDYLPYFIFVFKELGRAGLGRSRSRYRLEKVVAGDEVTVYSARDNRIYDDHPLMRFSDLVGGKEAESSEAMRVRLRFVTPTRLVSGNRLTDKVDFRLFLTSLLRRIAALSLCHCGQPFDFRPLLPGIEMVRTLRSDLAWHEWERFSTRQKASMKLGGVIGSVTFEGELGRYLPFLRLGEYVHLGKQTSFGLGQYVIESIEREVP